MRRADYDVICPYCGRPAVLYDDERSGASGHWYYRLTRDCPWCGEIMSVNYGIGGRYTATRYDKKEG